MTEPAELAAGFFDRFKDPKTLGLVCLGLFAAGIAIGFKLEGGMPVEIDTRQTFEPVQTSAEVPFVEPLDYVETPIEFEANE